VKAAVDRFGVPDAVINNAATIRRSPVVDTAIEAWDEQLAVNLRGPFLVSRAVLPGMLERRSGRIVQIGSISSTLGAARAAAYCASKWGLVGFTKSLAEELTDTGVMTMAILPGSVATRMLDGSGFSPRMTVDDVARTIAFYALEAPLAHNGGVVEMFGV
jgi:3-oxoacyl-[acyl-carrier protein] reductase